jgi:hypothetical protein
MLRKVSTFCIGFLLAVATSPQFASADVRGRVIDETGAAVVGASVYGSNADEAEITDASGNFLLAGKPTAITVVDDFHEPAAIDVRSSQTDVVITVQTTQARGAETIEIRGRARVAVPGATTVTREQVTRVPGSRGDVLAGVKNLPGIANNGSLTPFSAGLIIRGSSPQDSRILVDGFEVPVLYHFLGLQSVLPSEMVDDIEYQPGTFGVSQGRASGGLVAVRSRDGAKQLSGFAELSFVNLAALVQGPIAKRGSFAVAARRSVIDAILPAVIPSKAGLSFTAYPRYYDYQAKASYQATKQWKLSAFLFGSDDSVELLTDRDNAVDPAAAGGFSNATSFTRAIASATLRRGSFGFNVGVSAFVDQNHFSVGSNRFLRLDRKSIASRSEATWDQSKQLRLLAGAEFDVTRNQFDIFFTRPPREGDPRGPNFSQDASLNIKGHKVSPDLAAWTSATYYPLPNIELTAGIRAETFVRNRASLAQPRGQAVWHVSDGSTLRAAAGLYSRPAENLDERLQDDIKPERVWQTSAGAERKLTDAVTVQATAFYNRLNDLLVLRANRQDQMSLGGYENRGTGQAYGAELLLKVNTEKLFGWIAYTALHATRRDAPDMPSRLFDYDQAHNFIAVASWKLGRAWQLGARFQLTTGKPTTPVTGAMYQSDVDLYVPQYGAVNSQRVAAQHQLDIRIDHTWKLRGWKVAGYLDISNVYLNAAEVGVSYNFDYSARTPITTLPILPAFGLRGEF